MSRYSRCQRRSFQLTRPMSLVSTNVVMFSFDTDKQWTFHLTLNFQSKRDVPLYVYTRQFVIIFFISTIGFWSCRVCKSHEVTCSIIKHTLYLVGMSGTKPFMKQLCYLCKRTRTSTHRKVEMWKDILKLDVCMLSVN